jgi:hypothetical protein
MRGSRNKPDRRRAVTSALAAAATLLVVASPLHAQVGAPIPLMPPTSSAAPPDRPRAPHGVVVDRLAPPSPDAIGVLGATTHGFPDTLWQDSARSVVQALLPKIGATTSPTLQSLAYRLLATAATPPQGAGPAGTMLALRAERLTNALGRADTALILLQSLPPAQQGEDLAKVAVDLAFLAGNGTGACAQIRDRDRSWQGTYWDQGLVTCQALDGQAGQARLGLDVLREAKVKDDGFSALIERALGNDAKLPDTLPSPQPMALALLQKAGQGLPKKALDSAKLPVLNAVAVGSGFPAEQRLVAAEKAAAFGALEPERLAEAYLALPLEAEDRESPLNRADAVGGAKGRAILFQAARDSGVPAAKANFLQGLLAKAPRADLYSVVLRAAERLLLEVPASPDLKSVAIDFAHAMYALDRPNDARQWLEIADPEAGDSLLPLGHVVAGNAAPAWGETSLTELVANGKKDPALALRRAVLVGQLLAAEGTPLPDRLMLPLTEAKLGGAASVGPGLLIDSEAAGKHLGGTVLASLAALGDEGANAPSQTAAQAVAGLRAVGLIDDARHLAIDAAVAAGL